jgi:hypothetical protein
MPDIVEIDIKKINKTLAKRGLLAVYITADDESMDDEIQINKADGEITGVSVQICDTGGYVANYWHDTRDCRMGQIRNTFAPALKDALQFIDHI